MLTRRLTSLIQQAGSSWGVTRRRSYPFSIHSIQQADSSWGMTRRRSYPSSIQIIISFSIFIISISIQFIISFQFNSSFHFELSSWQACLGQSWLAAAFFFFACGPEIPQSQYNYLLNSFIFNFISAGRLVSRNDSPPLILLFNRLAFKVRHSHEQIHHFI